MSDRATDAALKSGGDGPHDPEMEARVAVLEQIAKDTREALTGIRSDLRSELSGVRGEMRDLRNDQRSDFRTLLGFLIGVGGLVLSLGIALLGVVAKGFHWL
jgi:hypothetical protein